MNKLLQKVQPLLRKMQPWARAHIWQFELLLATVAVIMVLTLLKNAFAFWALLISLFLYYAARLITVYTIEPSGASTGQETRQERRERWGIIRVLKRWRWPLLGLLVLAIIAFLLYYFVARQLPVNTQGYMTFFTSVGAIGAWVTGIALAIFAYQQWQMRHVEHSLLFIPRLLFSPVGPPITGMLEKDPVRYPYRVEWTVAIRNVSQIPIWIDRLALEVRLAGIADSKRAIFSPKDAHILEPADLIPPFDVTLSTPRKISWIIEGPNAGDTFDYVSGDSGSREFELVCRTSYSIPQSPNKWITDEIISEPCYVPENAGWGRSKYVLT